MGLFKKNGKWCIDYYFEGRRVRETVGPNKRVAEQALAVRKAEITQNRYTLSKRESVLFQDFAKEYLDYSRNHKKSYLRDITSTNHLTPYFKNKRLSDITSWLTERYKAIRKEKVAVATVNRELACLKHMFTLAIEWGKVNSNPVKRVKLFKEENKSLRVLSKEEEKKLIDASSEHLKPIIIMALNAGMRKGEILNLTWDKVDFANRIITVDKTKNNEVRQIPMNHYLADVLGNMKAVRKYVFCKENGEPYGSVRKAFRRAVERSGMPPCRFHDLRHTFASRLAMKGIDLATLKELLGHKSIGMTMRYAHPTQDHKRWAVEVLDMDTDGHYMDTKAELRNVGKVVTT